MGDSNAVIAVAFVDTKTGEVGVYAELPGTGPHMAVTAQKAVRLRIFARASRHHTSSVDEIDNR